MRLVTSLLFLVVLAAQARAAALPAFDIERRALDPTRKVQRVFVVLPASLGDDAPVSLKADLRRGARAIPVLSEYPLPWSDGRRALCVNWRTGEESRAGGPLRVTLAPGRGKRPAGVERVNLWPDPDIARPIRVGEGSWRPGDWYFGAMGQSRKYERWAAVAERIAGEGPSLRVKPSRQGNWYVAFWNRPNFAVTPGRRYTVALSYLTAEGNIGTLQIGYHEPGSVRYLRKARRAISRKPWVYHATDRWRRRRIAFTAPEGAGGATLYAKVGLPRVLWFRDFSALPVYPRAFDVEAVDLADGLTERRARFRVAASLAGESLLPACEAPPKGWEVWSLRSWPPRSGFTLAVAPEGRRRPEAARVSSRGIVDVPLPGRDGEFTVTFHISDRAGNLLARLRRTLRVRAGVLDMKGGAP